VTAADRAAAPRRGLWSRLVAADPEPIGPDAWAFRAALPRHGINVFLVREGDGVVCFDTGSRELVGELRRLAAPHGGIKRVVLSHSHFDHRGGARGLGLPVYCHAEASGDVEGNGGEYYPPGSPAKKVIKCRVMSKLRDGGSVTVAGTIGEGDSVGTFAVIDLPGHAPGQIGLWREQDRAIIVADAFYTFDERTAHYPHSLYGQDDELADATLRRVAALEPEVAWPGHGPPLVGDVRGALERCLAEAGRPV
jgi:glyoxylase-like metal-dependent hydrolase (beta-lactamase superfamily II)